MSQSEKNQSQVEMTEQRVKRLLMEDPEVRKQLAKTIAARRRKEEASRETRREILALQKLLAPEEVTDDPHVRGRSRFGFVELRVLVRLEGAVDLITVEGDPDGLDVLIDGLSNGASGLLELEVEI